MTDDVVVLEPGDDRAKKIGRAIASETAGDIVAVLRENGEATLSEIAAALGIPITSAKYHVEHLLEADIIRIVRTKYSEKGREVKVYGVRDQIVIVNPGTVPPTDIRRLLLKYASLFCLLAAATLLLAVAYPVLMPGGAVSGSPAAGDQMNLLMAAPAPAPEMMAADDADSVQITAKALPQAASAPVIPERPVHSLVLWFFAGGCLVILAMVVYEIVFWQTSRRDQRSRRD